MYAVIKTGGKQYRVEKDAVLQVEKLGVAAGDNVTFDDVLLIGDGDKVEIGTPQIDGATVTAEVLEQMRGPKIIVFKKKRRKNYRRTRGHRQDLTVVRITEILAEAKKKRARKAKPKSQETGPETGEGAGEPKAEATPKAEAKPKTKAKSAPKAKSGAKAEAKTKTTAKAKAGDKGTKETKPKAKPKAKAADKAKAKTPKASEE